MQNHLLPSLCSGTKYISIARSARCANKVAFWFNFYGLVNFVYMLPFTTRWIKKYIFPSHVKKLTREKTIIFKFFFVFLKIFLHSMTQSIKNQCIFLYKFDIKFAFLNLYGIIFHEKQACVCF